MGLESSKLKLGDIPERDPLDEDLVSVNDLDALELHDLLASKVSFYTMRLLVLIFTIGLMIATMKGV